MVCIKSIVSLFRNNIKKVAVAPVGLCQVVKESQGTENTTRLNFVALFYDILLIWFIRDLIRDAENPPKERYYLEFCKVGECSDTS